MVNIWPFIRQSLRRLQYSMAIIGIVFLPLTASLKVGADNCTPPTDSGIGIHYPVGADAGMFTYDCGSGMWLSSHYSYNPSTGLYTPLDPIVYTYNPQTGGYDYTVWQFYASQNAYVAVNQSVNVPPTGANIVGGPTEPTNSISNTGPGSNNTINDSGGATNGSSINNTGPNSNNSIDGTGANNSNSNNNTNATMNNTLTATANSGNSLVLGNTTADGAGSGDATDVANVMNLLQSASNALGGNAVTFVANINGDVTGDLTLDPSVLSNIQPAGSTGNNNTTINNTANATMNNNINLNANTGDATVANNTSGGDATSGTAKTIADVINVIDSAITSGRSFLGVININGNLNGDILLPPNFVDQLLAANVPTVNIITNTGAGSNNGITDASGSNNTNVTNTNNEGITNNITAAATTGTANVSNNTTAGNASSGTANTSITAFNLTGSSVIGSNDLLVFVNVVGGKWVGLIVNAPPGATAAELGGGIISSSPANNNTTVNNTTNDKITNNINLASKSGNASVTDNTKAGNAKSGNADAAVNLLNVENSSLSLSNWFGILFINVFGTWNGSFGINTAAGDPVASGGSLPGSFVAAPAFGFIPHTTTSGSNKGNNPSFARSFTGSGGSTVSGSSLVASAVLAAATTHGNNSSHNSAGQTQNHINWAFALSGSGAFFLYLLSERFYSVRRSRKSSL